MGTTGYVAKRRGPELTELSFELRGLRDKDVEIKISYYGVCHIDLHPVRNDWGAMNTH
jgi:D-arabinose 1-dehydrogenase-like Zn-dependent alcohol dehydrogenase